MQNNTKNRGFAAMDRDRQKEIARKGGKAAHQKGTAHEFTADEARAAGRKGGEAVSANRGHMSHIGRIGGKKSAGRKKQVSESPANMGQSMPHVDDAGPEARSQEAMASSEHQRAEDAA
jgi:general stress protein YciG